MFSDVTELVNALAAKDDFVSNVSHEFRTPLTSILGYVELMLDDDDDLTEYQRGPLEIIRRHSERLLTLVSDLLSSRNGQLIVSPRAVNVAAIPGVGLGLSISKAIVEAHGGSVSLRSEVGEGTTFTFAVPA